MIFRLTSFKYACVAVLTIASMVSPRAEAQPVAYSLQDAQAIKSRLLFHGQASSTTSDVKAQILDGSARILLNASSPQRVTKLSEQLNLAVDRDASGRLIADVFIQVDDIAAVQLVEEAGVDVRTRVGDILVARMPVDALNQLMETSGIRRVEVSKKSSARLDSSRVSIGADRVHQGIDLPQAYRGEGVVVGVIDSGIDFAHPDFSDDDGSRIQYLLEYTEDGGQNEWTKSEIDTNPTGVTQRDGNGDGGHGTHVAGVAVGGGRLDPHLTGIAPASDIIFVKGIREQESFGGYIDTDVVAGCQYVFDKADEMGKPAVVNVSIGRHLGPHDGTSLYEQALSGLVGPGRLIVAAAGNEADDLIHAGGQSTANVLNESIVLPDPSVERMAVTLWYEPGVVTAVAVFVYDQQLNFLGQATSIGVGSSLESDPVVVNNDTLGFVTIDAVTTQDPNNGDGNAIFLIDNGGNPSINLSEYIWAVGSRGDVEGRMDLWVAFGGRFFDQEVGFPDETEMPGNEDYSVSIPSTAEQVISAGSYVTRTSWFDLDGDSLWINPSPAIQSVSAFSSRGPTRDGRMAPDITAPGQLVFSALSSHLTEGVGYDRLVVLQGGGYFGQNGTSQASPHVAGTIALMLQVRPDLTYEEAIQILSETAHANALTGVTPNNDVGAGYLDAHAAVKSVAGLPISIAHTDTGLPENFILEQNYPNPFNPATTIEYALANSTRAVLKIYNLTGQQVKILVNTTQSTGRYSVLWDGTSDSGQPVVSGVYYATLTAGPASLTRKMVLLR